MAKTYRVGVIGRTGKGNYGHGIDTVWAQIDRADVVAVADENERGRAAAAKRTGAERAYADYRRMLEKETLDIVAIGPRWVDQHHDMVIAAAQHGCHMFLEKPLCRTLLEADWMVRECEKQRVKLTIASRTRYSPMIPVVKQMISQGKLGRILELRARGKEDRRGGAEDLWVLGTHLMDLLRIFGGDPVSCYALLTQNGRPVTKRDVYDGNEGLGLLAGNGVNAMYTFQGGITGYFASHRNQSGNPSRFGLQIFGSKGVLEIVTGYLSNVKFLPDPSWSPGRSGALWLNVSSHGIDKPETRKVTSPRPGNVAMVNDLIAAIEEDRQPLGNIYQARAMVEMIHAVFESHRVGGPVQFPLSNREHALAMLDS